VVLEAGSLKRKLNRLLLIKENLQKSNPGQVEQKIAVSEKRRS
jgi:hypothetical protein